jgi:hypothetical protein
MKELPSSYFSRPISKKQPTSFQPLTATTRSYTSSQDDNSFPNQQQQQQQQHASSKTNQNPKKKLFGKKNISKAPWVPSDTLSEIVPHGFCAVYKPRGFTSSDVVQKVCRERERERVLGIYWFSCYLFASLLLLLLCGSFPPVLTISFCPA